ncbi:MAG TPA: hypothetical protein VFG08_08155, partial [Candidatus Polarisedimenticolia bacterium]|nr:hypothetical protein [Candidatus Polarisedimenticolia bacterium]
RLPPGDARPADARLMYRVLLRLGGLIIVLDLVYLAAGELWFGGADDVLFRNFLKAGGACIAGGGAFWLAGRAAALVAGRTCPRCRRRVAHGRIYCDEHRSEAINEQRDRERDRGR